MVEVAILPILPEVIANECGTGGVFRIQFPFRLGFREPRPAFEQATEPFASGGVDEDVKGIAVPLKDALASPPDNYAIAHLGRLGNDPAAEFGCGIRVKSRGDRTAHVTSDA